MSGSAERVPHHHHRAREDRLRKSLDEGPDDPEGRALLALLLAIRGLHRDAITEARRALRLDPDTALARYALSVSIPGRFNRPGDLVQAIAEAEEAVRLDPLSPSYFAQLAHLHLLRYAHVLQPRHLDSALRAAEAGLTADPIDVPCTLFLGTALGKLGRHDEAERAYSTALALEPGGAYVHADYGEYLFRRGEFERALTSLREASRLDGRYRRRLGFVRAVTWAVDRFIKVASCLRLTRPGPGGDRLTSGCPMGAVNWWAGSLLWASVMSAALLMLLEVGDPSPLAFLVPVSLLSLVSAAMFERSRGMKRLAWGGVSLYSGLFWFMLPTFMFLSPGQISSVPRPAVFGLNLGAMFHPVRALGLLAVVGGLLFLGVVYLRAFLVRGATDSRAG